MGFYFILKKKEKIKVDNYVVTSIKEWSSKETIFRKCFHKSFSTTVTNNSETFHTYSSNCSINLNLSKIYTKIRCLFFHFISFPPFFFSLTHHDYCIFFVNNKQWPKCMSLEKCETSHMNAMSQWCWSLKSTLNFKV